MNAKQQITLGGRTFIPTPEGDMTFDQFAWIQTASEKAGLGTELMGLIEPYLQRVMEKEVQLSEGETESLTHKIVSRCYQERAHLDVLSGLLVEVGKKWRYADAEANREFFAGLTGKADIEKANALLAEAILSFFWNGLASMKTFQNSSQAPDVLIALKEKIEGEPAPDDDLAISGL